MNLTSWRRLQYQLGGDTPLTDTSKNKRKYLTWIPVISNRVESFLNRRLQLTTYTEYFDSLKDTLEYFVETYPITSIITVKSDSTGEFNGSSESEESDFYIGKDSRSFVLQTPVIQALRGLQVVYTGGFAIHGTQSLFTLTSESVVPITTNIFVQGRNSDAVGYVKLKSGANITIEVLYGIFEVGEVIDGKLTEDGVIVVNQNAVLLTSVSRCMAELFPEITQACELEIRYMDDHRDDYENISTMKGATTRKDMTVKNGESLFELLPEVASLLQTFVNIHI